jgi:hypothetical protein
MILFSVSGITNTSRKPSDVFVTRFFRVSVERMGNTPHFSLKLGEFSTLLSLKWTPQSDRAQVCKNNSFSKLSFKT